jgi:hypothetical protein
VVCVLGGLIIVACIAKLVSMNKLPELCMRKLPPRDDNAEWLALVRFSLQCWDLYSDINLAIEMWAFKQFNFNMLVISISATVFIVLPYILNLIIAARIRRYLASNILVLSWFKNHSSLFVSFVIFSGGCYPALALVS